MPVITRYQMIQVHMLLAAFLLPIALMYFISGLLYTLDIKGHVKKQEIVVQLEQLFTPNFDDLKKLTIKTLKQKNIPVPSGEPTLKKKKGMHELYWSDLGYAIKLRPTSDPMVATLTVKKRDYLTQVMRIHRAEAGLTFKVLAVLLVSGLMIILISGVVMALSVPKFKRAALRAMVLGFISLVVLIFI